MRPYWTRERTCLAYAWATLLATHAPSAGCADDQPGTGPAWGVVAVAGAGASAGGGMNVRAGAGAPSAGVSGSPTLKLSFAADVYDAVILKHCGACHNDAPSFGGLAFFPGGAAFAYTNLVGVAAGKGEGFLCRDSGLMRVSPGDPEHSLLYLKLTIPPCGSKMPAADFGEVAPEQLALVRQWIMDGANP
jgi:mono/diheme cytochrome c family protein